MKQSNSVEFLKRRIEILAGELGFDKERIQKWAVAQTVMAAVWNNDENGKGWEEDMAIAESLDKIKF
jgi:streptomycin 6-kinase